MKTLNMALCANRHEICEATDGAIFYDIKDVTKTQQLESVAYSRLWAKCYEIGAVKYASSVFPELDGTEYEDGLVIAPNTVALNLFVTGLTPALIAVLNVCKDYGVDVILFHYDRSTCKYFVQGVR